MQAYLNGALIIIGKNFPENGSQFAVVSPVVSNLFSLIKRSLLKGVKAEIKNNEIFFIKDKETFLYSPPQGFSLRGLVKDCKSILGARGWIRVKIG